MATGGAVEGSPLWNDPKSEMPIRVVQAVQAPHERVEGTCIFCVSGHFPRAAGAGPAVRCKRRVLLCGTLPCLAWRRRRTVPRRARFVLCLSCVCCMPDVGSPTRPSCVANQPHTLQVKRISRDAFIPASVHCLCVPQTNQSIQPGCSAHAASAGQVPCFHTKHTQIRAHGRTRANSLAVRVNRRGHTHI